MGPLKTPVLASPPVLEVSDDAAPALNATVDTPYVAGMGYQLSHDLFLAPTEGKSDGEAPVASPPAGLRPYGAQSSDTSEYMIGNVYVTVVLMESNGGTDAETEDWTAT
ncbi:MAG TPA: hypothetical protein VE890_14915, partial [Thermoguttaceae bacterium]|nr:hypothetical protein [Thermoguttaceae bacterium]